MKEKNKEDLNYAVYKCEHNYGIAYVGIAKFDNGRKYEMLKCMGCSTFFGTPVIEDKKESPDWILPSLIISLVITVIAFIIVTAVTFGYVDVLISVVSALVPLALIVLFLKLIAVLASWGGH